MDTIYCTSCGTANKPGARFCFKCGAPIEATETPAQVQTESNFITLSCPNCGGKLDITPDMERFACKYCGNEHLVRRSGGAVSLAPVVEGLKRVETKFDQVLTGSDRVAAEQTIQRLKAEIPELERQIYAKDAHIKLMQKNSLERKGRVLAITCAIIFPFSCSCPFLYKFFSYSSLYDSIFYTVNYSIRDPFEAIAPVVSALIPVAFFLCIITGAIMYGVSKNKEHTAAYGEQVGRAKMELAQLQAELQKRKEQLSQLHQYTAER